MNKMSNFRKIRYIFNYQYYKLYRDKDLWMYKKIVYKYNRQKLYIR